MVQEHLVALFTLALSYAAMYFMFRLRVFQSIKSQMLFVNVFRFMLGFSIATLRHFQKDKIALVAFLCAIPTYFLNLPKIRRMRLPHSSRTRKVDSAALKTRSSQQVQTVSISIVSDTLLIYPILFYFIATEKIDPTGIFCYMAGELWFSVYPILQFKRNRNFMLQFTELMALLAVFECLIDNMRLANLLFLACFVVQFINFVFCSIPRNQYANCLSIINLLCGAVAIVKQFSPFEDSKPQYHVLAWVLAGQFFDLFDGRAAERFGSTKNGEMFDDVADFTSFGLATGILVFKSFLLTFGVRKELAIAAGVAYVVTVAYRLIRFVVNKRKAGQKGGVRLFQGLPSPGTSAIVLCLTCLVQSFKIREETLFARYHSAILAAYTAVLALVCAVTVSYIGYAHFGRVFTNKKMFNPTLRSIVCVAYVYFLLLSITRRNMDYIVAYMTTCMLAYLLSPWMMAKMYEKINQYDREQNACTSEDDATGDDDEKQQE